MKQKAGLNHGQIEAKWQKKWAEAKLDVADIAGAKKPFYNLMMFPYPSAEGLHVGNMYAFTGSDIYGRFKRMQGYNVFEPIGLDGFGIHSENYAFKTDRHPMDHAKITEKSFYTQLRKIAAMFDWSRTLETYDTDYYRWTQWLFVQMFKHGLAYRGRAEVNFCPSCKTVLADEQVIDGRCERCGNTVEKRLLEQWFFRITAYAEKLLQNSFTLDWSEKVKVAQKNWIGKKEGINIIYPVVDGAGNPAGEITCFTTRPDTNFGATFVVIAPEHPFVTQITRVIKKEQADTIGKYVARAKQKTDDERIAEGKNKTGVPTGLFCINQLNGYKMPLFVSDFVLIGFGTGAVVGVPGHDMRDFEFARAMKLPIIRVVKGVDGDVSPITKKEQVQEEEGVMVNSEFLNGMPIQKAIGATMDHIVKKGWGKRVTTYHLRDWLISRQRYWGPPIPMIHCKKCAKEGKSWFTTHSVIPASEPESKGKNAWIPGQARDDKKTMSGWYPVPEDQLPVVLPRIADYKPGDDGVAPLAKHKEFYETTCPGCKGKAVRETDVSDTFLDSSWYFLRYPSVGISDAGPVAGFPPTPPTRGTPAAGGPPTRATRVDSAPQPFPWDPEITRRWLPVHMYTGGAEHSVLHLMYSRFVTMALKEWGYIDFEEPFSRFYAHGLVIKDGAKMSKSKGNIVNPDEYIALYGADALRLYLMFMGPFDQGGDFRDSAMEGMSRWVGRIWRLSQKSATGKVRSSPPVGGALHKLIKKVTEDVEKRRYNTAIASMMEFTNLVADEGGVSEKDLKLFVLLLAPFAPHLAEELWSRHGGSFSVHTQPWPAFDPANIVDEEITVVVQVNGKVRDSLIVSRDSIQKDIEASAKRSEKIQNYLDGKPVRKVIFVPGRLINFVV